MQIKHSILIHADISTVWRIFTDLTCWEKWSRVMSDVETESKKIREGKSFSFCIRPFVFPINVEPVVEEIIHEKRIVWSGRKFGIAARHEFIFDNEEGKVILKSKETFRTFLPIYFILFFTRNKLKELSFMMLEELKKAAENDS